MPNSLNYFPTDEETRNEMIFKIIYFVNNYCITI
jgi:hypothetical protein